MLFSIRAVMTHAREEGRSLTVLNIYLLGANEIAGAGPLLTYIVRAR